MYDVIIIGAGPAGLMTSIVCNKNVLILEKNSKPGKKLLITGGGRCNVTNLKSNNDFLSKVHNKKYLYSAINTFGPFDIYNYFTNRGVSLTEEVDNKIFPVSDKASYILNCLLNDTKAIIKYNEEVININYVNSMYEIVTNENKYTAKFVVVATGGSSFKITGSTGDNMKFAKELNQPTISLYPAEVGISLKEKVDLAGTSLNDVEVKCNKYKSNGNLIFTHNGLSGSAIMNISEYIYLTKEVIITIDLLNNISSSELLESLNKFDREKKVQTFLTNHFSKKFSLYLLNRLNMLPNIKIKSLNDKVKLELINLIKNCSFNVLKVGSIDESYVTGGGIDMKYIDSTSMESNINKNLYFVGEALDIHGPVGGYNITLALS